VNINPYLLSCKVNSMNRRNLLLITLLILGCNNFARGQASICPPNVDFEMGNLSVWNFFNGTVATGPIFSLTATAPVASREVLTPVGATVLDGYGNFSTVAPGGGLHSCKLGSDANVNLAERAIYYINIPPGTTTYSVVYHYATVLEIPPPSSPHTPAEEPRFVIGAYDSATDAAIPCAAYTYVSGAAGTGFIHSSVPSPYFANGNDVYYKPWTFGNMKFPGMNGRTVALEVTANDCTLGAHFGYGYFDMSCDLFANVIACGTTSETLTAPPGFISYQWLDSTTMLTSYGTTQSVTVPAPSVPTTYACIITPAAGYGCPDTLYSRLIPTHLLIAPTNDTTICSGNSVSMSLNATDITSPLVYNWTPSAGLSCTNCANPTATPAVTTAYTATVTDPGGCAQVHVFNITVFHTPGPITGNLHACLGVPVPLSDGVAGGVWTSANTAAATIGSSSGSVFGLSLDTSTITYAFGNGLCATSVVVTVNPIPAPITGSSPVCAGSTLALSDATTGGTWTSSNTAIATVDPATGLVGGNSVLGGSATIFYADGGTGCPVTTTVTVNPLSPITGVTNVCTGLTTQLSDITTGGTWMSSNIAIATVDPTGLVPGVSTAGGVDTITYTTPAGCTTIAAITVNPLPAVITGNLFLCPGTSTTLSDATTGGVWSSSTTSVATILPSGVATAAGVIGTDTISYTLGTGCLVKAAVTVNSTPPAIAGALNLCTGTTTALSDGVTGGTWTSASTGIATVGSSSGIVSGVTVTGGTSLITYTSPAGCVITATVTVNRLPAGITGVMTVCEGLTTTLHDATTGGSWSTAASSTATVVSGSGVVSGVTASTTTVIYTLATGCTASAVLTVNVTPVVIAGPLNVCTGATITLADATSGGTWLSGNTAIVSIGNTTGVVTGVTTTGGTSVITYMMPTGCLNTATVTVNPLPPLFTVTGGGVYCAGGAGLHVGLGGSTGGVMYQLFNGASPAGFPLSGSGSALDFGLQTAGGTYTVAAVNSVTGCSRAMTGSVTVSINPVPAVIPISGGGSYCAGGAGFHITLGGSVVGINYQLHNGLFISPVMAGTGSALDFGAETLDGTYTVTATNPLTSCTSIMSGTAVITVLPLPPLFTITGGGGYCAGGSGVAIGLPGSTAGIGYELYNGATGIGVIAGSGGPLSFGLQTAPGTYRILAFNSATTCSDTMTGTATVVINPLPAPIAGPATVCVGATITETDASIGGTWSSSITANASIGSATGIITGGTSSSSTLITYTLPTGCITTRTINVSLSPGPISGPGAVCVGSLITETDGVSGGAWTSSNTAIANTTTPPGTVSGVAEGTAAIIYTIPSTGCFTSAPVTVNPLPLPITGATIACVGLSTILHDAATGGTWSSGATTIATVTSPGGTVWGAGGGTASITYTLPTTCAVSVPVTVFPSPGPIAGPGSVCQNATMILADVITGGAWSSSNTGVATIGLISGTVYPIIPSTTTITYTLPGNCTTTKVITVNPIAAITGPGAVCQGATITLSDGTPGGTWSSGATAVATVNAAGVVGGVNPGTSVITYTTPAGCTTSFTITVNIAPTPITGSASVCAGLSTSLGDGVGGGTWISSNTSVATIAPVSTIWGAVAGTSTITYTLGDGCSTTVIITVNPLPAPITGAATVCVNSTITLHDATPGGTWSSSLTSLASVDAGGTVAGRGPGSVVITYTNSLTGCIITTSLTVNPLPAPLLGPASMCVDYTTVLTEATTGGIWGSSATSIATVATGAGTIYGVSPGTSVISYTLPTGCAAIQMVTVVPVPTVIAGLPMVCVGQFIALSVPGAPGGTWSSGPAALATIGLTNGVLAGVSSGTVIVSYTIGVGCNVIDSRIVNALSPIFGDSVLCVGDMVTLTDTTEGGIWSSTSTTVATAITTGLSTGSATATGAGTTAIKYTLPTGCVANYIVTVNPPPSPITGGTNVCIDNITTLNDATTGGAWSISGGAGTAYIDPLSGAVTGVAAGPVNILYTLTATGCSAGTTVNVNVLPLPISGPSFVCPGSTITLSDVGSGAWSVSTSSVATIGSASGMLTGLNPGVTSATYTLPVTGCSTSIDVTVAPLPSAITGSSIVCFGSTSVLGDITVGGVWSSSNTLVAPIGLFSGAIYGANLGTATITFTTSFGCTASKEVTVDPSPAPITGTGAVCPAGTLILGEITTGGVWSSSHTLIATVTSDGAVTGVAGGTSTISYTLGVCPSTAVVTINPSPAPITGALHVCSIGTGTMLDASSGGTWSSSNMGAATVISASGFITGVTPGTTTITYTLPTSCTITATVTVDSMPVAISGPNHTCIGSTITLTDGVGGGTWVSSVPGVATVGTFTGIVTGSVPGSTMITYAIGACNVSSIINVYSLPFKDTVTGGGAYCAGGSGVTVGLTGSTPGVLYYLYHGSTPTGTFAGTGTPLSFGLQTVGGYYTVVAVTSATGCSNLMDDSALITLTPTVLPAVSIAETPGLEVCAGTAVTFNPVPVNGGSAPVYQWKVNGVDVASTTGYTFVPAMGDVVKVQMTSNIQCPSPATVSANVTMTVNLPGTPQVGIASNPGDTVCSGSLVTLTAMPTYGGPSPGYVWNRNGADAGTDPIFSFVAGNGDVVYCTMTSNYMCRLATTAVSNNVVMTVDTPMTPTVTISATPGTDISVGALDTLVASVAHGGVSPAYQWFKNGLPVAGATTNTYISNNFSYPVEDSITCMVTADDACRITSFQWVYINAGKLGVTPVLSGTSDIAVIPNPNKGTFVVKGSLGVTRDEEVQLEITNMLGQVVYRNNIVAHNGNVNERVSLSNTIANGMYLLSVHSAVGNDVFHIVVEQ